MVGIVMGSDSDLPIMREAADILEKFEIPFRISIVSAHRTPDYLYRYGQQAVENGVKLIIAGAGGAAHLPGMLAAITIAPVIGVPIQTSALKGIDSLYSIVQMPKGVPVATVAINGGLNAGLLAAQMIGSFHQEIAAKVDQYKKDLRESVLEKDLLLEKIGYRNYLERKNVN